MKLNRSKEWWMEKARLEEGHTVMAGVPGREPLREDVDEVTLLFVSSLWLWLLGDELGAKATMDASLYIHSLNVAFASDFRS